MTKAARDPNSEIGSRLPREPAPNDASLGAPASLPASHSGPHHTFGEAGPPWFTWQGGSKRLIFLAGTSLLGFTICSGAELTALSPDGKGEVPRNFIVKGVVAEIKTDGKTMVIRHEAIADYMDAMTMPFKVKEPKALTGLQAGDEISFRLQVTSTESWIDGIVKSGTRPHGEDASPAKPESAGTSSVRKRHPLMDYKFTNELGQAVSLADFRGQALAITFFFTRCPIPDYCPRLSKNFQAASEKLSATGGGPTNWHFLSVTFDPEFDSPGVLKAYGEMYHYDPSHWSFLTGPSNQVSELARQSDVKFDRDGAFYNHNFRTLIIDAAGHVQMIFPMGGDLSDSIVEEMRKAGAEH